MPDTPDGSLGTQLLTGQDTITPVEGQPGPGYRYPGLFPRILLADTE